MDTFFEQIVSMKLKFKQISVIILLWFIAALLSLGSVLFIFGGTISVISIALVIAIFYGAYYLTTKFFIEYEYIITNNSFDIDKIISKKSRKRLASFEISQVESIEKYNPNAKDNTRFAEILKVCNASDEAYQLIFKDGTSLTKVIFAPDERIKKAIVKFLPRHLSNSVFK